MKVLICVMWVALAGVAVTSCSFENSKAADIESRVQYLEKTVEMLRRRVVDLEERSR